MSQINTPVAIVLFSKNWAGKGQAGRYTADAIERARAVANKNGCSVVAFTPDDDADLLAAVPEGRFGAQDRPLLPSAKVAIFKRLVAMAERQDQEGRGDGREADTSPQKAAKADDATRAEDQPPAKAGKKTGTPKAAAMLAKMSEKASGGTIVSVIVKDGANHWPDLAKGDVVLAPEFDNGEYSGWWEAVVRARSETHVTLDWRDYPDLPTFTVPITQVAPIHPECKIEG